MQVSDLTSNWSVAQRGHLPSYHRPQLPPSAHVPATVPGYVHLDLLEAGIIADPFTSRHEIGCQWIDTSDWTYTCIFDWSPNDLNPTRVLRFEGIDTVCRIFLNDHLIGENDNMFLPLECDVTSLLVSGENTLRVEIDSAVRVGTERREAWFNSHSLPQDYNWFDERAFVRKAGYMSGWDWGPRLAAPGIWKPIQLLEFPDRITDLRVDTDEQPDGSFIVTAHATTHCESTPTYSFTPHESAQVTQLTPNSWRVEGERWWPLGYGNQPLHTVSASLADHTATKRIGLRTITLRRELDEFGRDFTFVVNGKPIYACGANWIPDDSFPSRCTRDSYREQVTRFADLNMNMLRVWGGGFYESDDFYDICDELGVLVWQDFPFGCMYYPDDAPWQEVIRHEATVHVNRLRHHASLALWCGNNENLAMFLGTWGGPGQKVPRYYGEHHYHQVLPEVVAEIDGKTSYIRTSPVMIEDEDKDRPGVTADTYGDSHYWDVWHGRGDWIYYSDSTCRFSSEFGFASSCSLDLWEETLTDDERAIFPSPALLHHDKTGKPWPTFLGYITAHYPEPVSVEDWMYTSQLNQRDALRYGIEYFRRAEFCKGSLIWQANDCWPVQSWAVQDYLRHLKPAGFELKRLYNHVMISLDHVAGASEMKVHLTNDSFDKKAVTLEAEFFNTVTGDAIHSSCQSWNLEPGTRALVTTLDLQHFDHKSTAVRLRIQDDPESDRWAFLAEPKDMKWGTPHITVTQGETLRLTVQGFAPDLVVWDPTDGTTVQSTTTLQPGLQPKTLVNETAEYNLLGPVQTLIVRSLAGRHEITVCASAGS